MQLEYTRAVFLSLIVFTVFNIDVGSSATIYETAVATPDLSTLVAAIDAAGSAVKDALNDPTSTLTIFAPSNGAFEDLLERCKRGNQKGTMNENATIDDLLALSGLSNIILNHGLPSVVMKDDWATTVEGAEHVITTLIGQELSVTKYSEEDTGGAIPGISIRGITDLDGNAGNAGVEIADIVCDGGVVHIIGGVFVPPAIMGYGNFLEKSADHTILNSQIGYTPYDKALFEADGWFTIFAPTDAAFENLMAELGMTQTAELSWWGKTFQNALVGLHITQGAIASSDLTDGQTYTGLDVVEHDIYGEETGDMLKGETATVTVAAAGAVSIKGPTVEALNFITDANVIQADVIALNGVIHVVDQIILSKNAIDDWKAKQQPAPVPAPAPAPVDDGFVWPECVSSSGYCTPEMFKTKGLTCDEQVEQATYCLSPTKGHDCTKEDAMEIFDYLVRMDGVVSGGCVEDQVMPIFGVNAVDSAATRVSVAVLLALVIALAAL